MGEQEEEEEVKMEGSPKFPAFPFKPYPIQLQFMNALYDSLQKGGIAMFESPTGTGKTMSIICSALQWVVDQHSNPDGVHSMKPKTEDFGTCRASQDDEPDWIRDFVIANTEEQHDAKVAVEKRRLGVSSGKFPNKKSQSSCRSLFLENRDEIDKEWKKSGATPEVDEDEEFLVDEYESEEEEGIEDGKMKTSNSLSSSSDEEVDKEEEEVLKVYFCSRTHSQLSQFVRELQRTVFASKLKVICLGSRNTLCTNPDVLKLKSLTRINERCLELQKNKSQGRPKSKIGDEAKKCCTKQSSGCPMLRKQKLQKQFRNEICQRGALDIEDLVQLGHKIGTCPYYGSRGMAKGANLVILPYQSLLLRSSRESLGLNLKNSIVIIDEAHNLADSLTNMYNSKITVPQLEQVVYHLKLYLERFQNLLGASNRRYIQILIVLTQSFRRLLLGNMNVDSISPCQTEQAAEEFGDKNASFDNSMTINDFLFCLEIDNINFIKLRKYIKESNIVHKVSGYGIKLDNSLRDSGQLSLDDGLGSNAEGSVLSSFQALVEFLFSLTNCDSDGRIIISKQSRTLSEEKEVGYLKFIMLAGEKIFSEILEQAHAVVLVGGTLQPIEEMRQRLFPCLPADRLQFFSCDHIIPPESILPVAVSSGPTGKVFDFSYKSRSSPSMIEELGRFLCNIVAVVPEGIVVFFSSFEYEKQVYNAWKASGILERILKKKLVFREPKSNSGVEAVLKEYKEAITLSSGNSVEDSVNHGALLLAVVGAKISEGINFSDGMGRCVIIVGLPYPSPSDLELIERIKHIEGMGRLNAAGSAQILGSSIYAENAAQSAFDTLRSCKQGGREYYENICMKAVNQSIGRAIRHIDDYAAMLLVDSRYICNASNRSFSCPTNKLPRWIKDHLVSVAGNYGKVQMLLHQFFKFNRQRGRQ